MLLKGGEIITENNIKRADIRIEGEQIKEIATNLVPKPKEEVIDVTNKLIFPGIIDSHTHFKLHSRGTVTADDFYWGGRSAAFGGVTTVIDYADQTSNSLLAGVKKRIDEIDNAVIDYNLHLVLNNNFQPQNHCNELYKVKQFGISSIKLFTTYRDMYMIDDRKWLSLLKAAKEAKILVTVHAEKDEIINKKKKLYKSINKLGIKHHPDIRPGSAEGEAVKDLCEYIENLKMPIYIVHLSSKEGYNQVLKGQRSGINIRAETTPHYLLLTRKLLEKPKGQLHLMTPPLRQEEDNKMLWEGIMTEIIDVVATDHCAFNVEQKQKGKDCLQVLPGIPGVETLLPLIYTYGVEKNKITLSRMVDLLSTMPAKIFGLYPQKGSLQIGSDADLVVFDPTKEVTLNQQMLHSKAGYTSFEGMQIKGIPMITMLRGNILVQNGKFLGKRGFGKFIKGGESSLYSEELEE